MWTKRKNQKHDSSSSAHWNDEVCATKLCAAPILSIAVRPRSHSEIRYENGASHPPPIKTPQKNKTKRPSSSHAVCPQKSASSFDNLDEICQSVYFTNNITLRLLQQHPTIEGTEMPPNNHHFRSLCNIQPTAASIKTEVIETIASSLTPKNLEIV